MPSILPFMEVNLSMLVENYEFLKQHASNTTVASVIKGNAYSLGKNMIFKTLFEAGCRHFYLSDWQEVLDLPKEFVKESNLYALAGVECDDFADAVKHRVIPVFHRRDQVEQWTKAGHNQCALQINTGLNRLGFLPEDVVEVKDKAEVEFILTQLSCGYDLKHKSNEESLLSMCRTSSQIGAPASMASSSSFLLDSSLALHKSHMVRAGRFLYGIKPPFLRSHNIVAQLKPAASLYACLISTRSVKAGDHVGYDYAFCADEDMEIGILNIGYSSGYYMFGKDQSVYSDGRYFRIISQSMDFTTIDITGFTPKLGQFFELFGEHVSQDHQKYKLMMPNSSISRRYIW